MQKPGPITVGCESDAAIHTRPVDVLFSESPRLGGGRAAELGDFSQRAACRGSQGEVRSTGTSEPPLPRRVEAARQDRGDVDPAFVTNPFTASKGPLAPAYTPLSDLISRIGRFSSMRLRSHARAKTPAREEDGRK